MDRCLNPILQGPEIFKCTGCPIDWSKGKNLTVKQVKKKQKHKSKGSVRTITKQVKADSFFNFFDPPAVPDDPNAEVDEDTQVQFASRRASILVCCYQSHFSATLIGSLLIV